jgi:cytochrome c556
MKMVEQPRTNNADTHAPIASRCRSSAFRLTRLPRMGLCVLGVVATVAGACKQGDDSAGEEQSRREGAGWLQGTTDERFAQVARQLRGFDMAMVETGYRYGELYWAGKDRNWEYAAYQAEKIATTIENGLERRPKRAESARMLDGPLAEVRKAAQARDTEAFHAAFDALTATCNACHAAERMPFVVVREPAIRLSPVDASAVQSPGRVGDDTHP